MRRKRRNQGQTLVETMLGFIVLIPIGLAAVNVVTLISTSQNNEQWAEIAARAAATKPDQTTALKAAQDAITECEINSIVKSVAIKEVKFDLATGHVTVNTAMQVQLPVPIPGFSEINCSASSIQPIVSTPAPR